MQDFTGVPAVVGISPPCATRWSISARSREDQSAGAGRSGVIDHSVARQFLRPPRIPSSAMSKKNTSRTRSVIDFLKWAQLSFENFRVVPPGTGIATRSTWNIWPRRCAASRRRSNLPTKPAPASLRFRIPWSGTDSHTTMRTDWPCSAGVSAASRPRPRCSASPIDAAAGGDRGSALRQAQEGVTATDLFSTRYANAAPARRGRQIRRIFRPRSRRPDHRRPRNARQHVAGIWRDLRVFSDR